MNRRQKCEQVFRPIVELLETRQLLSGFYHNLAAGPFSQDWSNLLQLTQNDSWTASPSIIGYRGDNIVRREGANPQAFALFNGPNGAIVDINPNQINPDASTLGGVAEFHLTDPVVALQANSTADAPFLLFHVSTLGTTNVNVSYKLRDIDGSADDAVTPVALQYRVGDAGPFINIPSGYVADATTGPNLAGLETSVNVTLPVAAENQAKVQVRIITANALGTDEWVGVDDVAFTSSIVSPSATLRIVTYNVSSYSDAPETGLETILQAIGNESSYGASRPIDVLALQEVQSQSTTTQTIVTLLNNIYGSGAYARGFLNGNTTGSGTQGIIYRTSTVSLLAEKAVGVSSTTGQPRQALRYHLRPVAIGSAGDFYLYNSHYKADDDSTSQDRRLTEALAIRADADALGQGVHIIYSGDFNLYSSSEDAYQELLSSGNGQAFDPVNDPGSWHENSGYVDLFTQAPAQSPPPGLTGGGLDDRFDFHLNTGEWTDGFGMEYVVGSYHAFANNGTVPLNENITYFQNSALSELANKTAVLGLLTTVTDHLPVVADYYFVPAGSPIPVPGPQRNAAATITPFEFDDAGPVVTIAATADTRPQLLQPDLGATSGPPDVVASIGDRVIRQLVRPMFPLFSVPSLLYNEDSYQGQLVGDWK